MTRTRVAFVQDHLVQRGGAERVLLAMCRAVPDATVVTPFYEPDACYGAFRQVPMVTSPLNRVAAVRRRHRATLPVLPLVVRALPVDADVVVCGTSGWAQGVRTDARKVVLFHGLARWLHEQEAYLKGAGPLRRAAARALAPPLRRWDRATMATGHRFLAASTDMCRRASDLYGVEVELLRLPNTLGTTGPREAPVDDLEPGFFLCVSRLMPYKNVDVVVEAFREMPHERLVVAGDGPLLGVLSASAPSNVRFLGRCEDPQLRWLYEASQGLVTVAVEPFGLTPVEAGAFGTPTVALAAGGFLDTVVDGATGVHVDEPTPAAVVAGIRRLQGLRPDPAEVAAHAGQYDEAAFAASLRHLVHEEHDRHDPEIPVISDVL